MNPRETALLNSAIAKRKAVIEEQKKLPKGQRNEAVLHDHYNRVAIMKHWIKHF